MGTKFLLNFGLVAPTCLVPQKSSWYQKAPKKVSAANLKIFLSNYVVFSRNSLRRFLGGSISRGFALYMKRSSVERNIMASGNIVESIRLSLVMCCLLVLSIIGSPCRCRSVNFVVHDFFLAFGSKKSMIVWQGQNLRRERTKPICWMHAIKGVVCESESWIPCLLSSHKLLCVYRHDSMMLCIIERVSLPSPGL